MELPQALLTIAETLARRHARIQKLDMGVVLSLAYAYAIEAVERLKVKGTATTEIEPESIALFRSIFTTRLRSDYHDETKLYGPTCAALRKRKQRKKAVVSLRRNTQDYLRDAVVRDITGQYDFLDQFSNKLQTYVLLVLAGYTQTELMEQFGFTRSQLSTLKGQLEDVYARF